MTWLPSERMKRVARAVVPWFDPGSRRPLILLVVVSLGVFLAPLAFDVAKAAYLGLPRWLRWSFGQGMLLTLMGAGIWRLGKVRPTDTWPDSPGSGGPEGLTPAARWVPWGLRLAVASLAIPIMENPDGLGFADWDFVLDKFEALRRSVLVWGQFPWWTPWCRGGFPLAAEPQIGAVSIATPLVLLLGTTIGLRLSAILCIWIAVEGAYRLGFQWLREPWSAAVVALVYGLNGGVVIDTAWGYIIAMSYCSLPWLVYHAFRIGHRPAEGVWLGFWTAFVVLNGIQYLSLYAAILAGLAWLRALRVQPHGRRVGLLLHIAIAVGTFFLLCGWRFVTVVLVILEDRRDRASYWDESPLSALHFLLDRPGSDWSTSIPWYHLATYIETTCYVGPLVVLLGLASLRQGWRWWHLLTLACGWLALGGNHWYQPSYWLADWPFFASTHVVTRWRFVAVLGLGLAAGSVLARWRRSGGRVVGGLAVGLTLAIAVDLVSLAYRQLPLAFSLKADPSSFPGPPVADILNVKEGLGYACVSRGYGVIRGYEPMLSGYRRDAPSLRRARDDPDYRGEAWTSAGEVRPVSWSPNRIEFRAAPGEEVHINQNPGSWWWVNGRQAFPGMRCAEALKPFVVNADDRGRIVLEIWPRGLALGLILHPIGAVLLAGSWFALRRHQGWRPDGVSRDSGQGVVDDD